MSSVKAFSYFYFYFYFYFYSYFSISLFLSFSELADGFLRKEDTFRRKVSLELNPGLIPRVAPPEVSLVYARAVGDNDTLHFVLSSGGAPTLLIIHSNSTESLLNVDWPSFLSTNATGALRIEPQSSVRYSSALVLTRLWELEALNSTEELVFPPYELQNFAWEDPNGTMDYFHHTVALCGTHSSFSPNGSLCLNFSAFESEGREEAWPSLLHNANSSQLQVLLDGVVPRSNKSRFALELQMVMGAELQSRVNVDSSIDDEYTPSIFKVSEWVWTDRNSSSSVLGFSKWKPVAYHKPLPAIEDASPCSHSDPVLITQAPPSRTVSAYFTHNSVTHGLNITFHNADESDSDSAPFISWTVLAGVGRPPIDFFSPLVIAIMAVGLGMPLLLLLVGGVYVCIRKGERDRAGTYQPIN